MPFYTKCSCVAGFTNMLYPGAVHTRFEHSVGVYWLAGNAVEKLKAHQVRNIF